MIVRRLIKLLLDATHTRDRVTVELDRGCPACGAALAASIVGGRPGDLGEYMVGVDLAIAPPKAEAGTGDEGEPSAGAEVSQTAAGLEPWTCMDCGRVSCIQTRFCCGASADGRCFKGGVDDSACFRCWVKHARLVHPEWPGFQHLQPGMDAAGCAL